MDIKPIPTTIKEAVDQIVGSLTPAEQEIILKHPHPARYHHTVGLAIRNEWGLWEPDSPLKRDAVQTYRIAHGDDISGLILAWVVARVTGGEHFDPLARVAGESFDPFAHVQRAHDHWANPAYGAKTSLEAGGWKPDGSGPLDPEPSRGSVQMRIRADAPPEEAKPTTDQVDHPRHARIALQLAADPPTIGSYTGTLTPRLRWRGGVLEQCVSCQNGIRMWERWQPVPTAED